jgi:hypothetical protein
MKGIKTNVLQIIKRRHQILLIHPRSQNTPKKKLTCGKEYHMVCIEIEQRMTLLHRAGKEKHCSSYGEK